MSRVGQRGLASHPTTSPLGSYQPPPDPGGRRLPTAAELCGEDLSVPHGTEEGTISGPSRHTDGALGKGESDGLGHVGTEESRGESPSPPLHPRRRPTPTKRPKLQSRVPTRPDTGLNSAATSPRIVTTKIDARSDAERVQVLRDAAAARAAEPVWSARGRLMVVRPIPAWKTCSSCGRVRRAFAFYLDFRASRGLASQCSACSRASGRRSWLASRIGGGRGVTERYRRFLVIARDMPGRLAKQLAATPLDLNDPASLEARARGLRRLADLLWRTNIAHARIEQDELVASGRKRCGRCAEVKPLHAFHRTRHSTDGHHWVCRTCARLYGQARRAKARAGRVPS